MDLTLPNSASHDFSDRISRVVAIKGANASGKTQLLKALFFLKMFAIGSFNNEPSSDIEVSSHFENESPVNFEIVISIAGVVYKYEVSITSKEVVEEKLSRKLERYSILFHRKFNNVVKVADEFKSLKSIVLRSNASIISTARYLENKSIDFLVEFFLSFHTNVGYFGRKQNILDIHYVAQILNDRSDIKKYVEDTLKRFDTGIDSIKILSALNENGEKYFFPLFMHDIDGEKFSVTRFEESSGTLALFCQLPIYFLAINTGGLLILDEFDVHLHPDIIPHLLRLFSSEVLNPKGAQLIVTTHDNSILDMIGKYRTHIVQKEKNQSFVYRLDEIPAGLIRNDRLIEPIYRAGKLGGVPKVKENA